MNILLWKVTKKLEISLGQIFEAEGDFILRDLTYFISLFLSFFSTQVHFCLKVPHWDDRVCVGSTGLQCLKCESVV